MLLLVFYLCCTTLHHSRAWEIEGAACDYTESGQMERGFVIPHVTAELGCNLLFHDSRAQFSPSLTGTFVSVSWIRPPSPVYTGELWKMWLGFEWMEARLTRGQAVSSRLLMAVSGCRVQSDPNGKLAGIPASCCYVGGILGNETGFGDSPLAVLGTPVEGETPCVSYANAGASPGTALQCMEPWFLCLSI